MTALLTLFQQALRRLAKAPFATGLAILTLAPGIGAHVAIFSLVDVLFLRPLPLPDAGRVMGIYETRDGRGYSPLSLPDYLDYRRTSRSWSALASHYPTAPLSLSTAQGSVEINASVVSANYFAVLRVRPVRGRFFLPEEDAAPGKSPVVILSHALWRSRFGGRREVLGQVIRLNGTSFTVVGVAPPGFTGVLLGLPSDLWLPNAMAAVGYRWCDPRSRDCTWLSLIGRLRAGRTPVQAQAEMTALAAGLRAAHPSPGEVRGLAVTPLRGVHPGSRPDVLRLAALLLGGVSLVVAVAGANLSSLLLARSLARRQEIAVRLALGATRRSVVSQFVAEALLPALLAAAAGLLLAAWIGRLVVALYPSDVPLRLGVDLREVGYAFLLATFAGLAVGLVPGLQASRPSLVPALKDDGRTTGFGRQRLLGLLIVVQIALSFVLLTSTGLLARSVARAGQQGIDPAGIVTLRLRPRLLAYGPRQGQAFSHEALSRLARLPGVRSASLAVQLPPWVGEPVPVSLPGQQAGPPAEGLRALKGEIAPRYFATLGVPILRGRDFSDRDGVGRPPVAIVSQALARRLWPNGAAIGRRLVVAGGASREVVGLVPDVGYRQALATPAGEVYVPYWQEAGEIDARLAVRVAGDPAELLPVLRRELHAIDPDVPVTEVGPLSASLDQLVAPVRVAGNVLGLAAGLALFLAAVGLYGTLSLAVARRTRDIGIRLALGASRRQAVAAVVREAAILVSLALGLGLAAAYGASGLLAHSLYGVSPRDPLIFAAALLVLALLAALASWLPARRASRVDPRVDLQAP